VRRERGAFLVAVSLTERSGPPVPAPGPESPNATTQTGCCAVIVAIVTSSRESTCPVDSCFLAVEDVTEERRSLVRHATLVFDLVRGDALPREESRMLILEVAEQWKTR